MPFIHSLFQWITDADEALLLAINGFHTAFLDTIMWVLSDKLIWVPLYFGFCHITLPYDNLLFIACLA